MKKGSLLFVLLLFAFCVNAANRNASINVDSSIKYQHVSGFGGFSPSPSWQWWLNDYDMDRLFGQSDSQLGYNILRLYISNNKNYWGAGVANAKRAKQHGAFIFASPWSPPASWKSNNNTSNGGKLLESHWGDWADFLNDYYDYMKGQGVTIDAISIQNEPDWNAEYESCIWTGEELARFLKQYGSRIKCKVIAPEAIHFTRSMHEPILNDADACAQLDILGGHFYGWDGSSYPLAAQKGKEVWMTEFLINERQQNNNQNIDWNNDGFLFARSINDAMLANMSAWVHYSLKRYYGAIGDGQYGTTDGAITKRGYILSQYAKYVSGNTRVRHALDDASGKLSSSAYINDAGDKVVIMVLNPSGDTYSTKVTLPFTTEGGKQIVTSSSQNAASTSINITETYTPTVNVGAYTVSTFVFNKKNARTDNGGSSASGTIVFSDGFDLSGASCIPTGWISKNEEETRHAGNYSMGSRVMSFSAEGAMQYGFYFRSTANQDAYISYGEESSQRLTLQPGKYTVAYSTVGWKANQEITFNLLTTSGTTVKSQSSTTTANISANGSSVRIISTTDSSVEFEVTAAGTYIMKWTMAKSDGGYREALVGNVRIIKADAAPNGSTNTNTPTANDAIVTGNAMYDAASGRYYFYTPNYSSFTFSQFNGKKIADNYKLTIKCGAESTIGYRLDIGVKKSNGEFYTESINGLDAESHYQIGNEAAGTRMPETAIEKTFDLREILKDYLAIDANCTIENIRINTVVQYGAEDTDRTGKYFITINELSLSDGSVNLYDLQMYDYTSGSAVAEEADKKLLDGTTVYEAGTEIYGKNGNVHYLHYTDLSDYDKMVIEGGGGLRIMFNRKIDGGTVQDGNLIEINPTFENGKAIINLSNYEYVHLHSIKVAWGSSATISSIKLYEAEKQNEGPEVPTEPDTDIAQYANIIYLLNETATVGSTHTLSIKMKNNFEVNGFQFDMYLPEGVTFAMNEDNECICALSTERTTHDRTNYFASKTQEDGALRVLCNTTTGLNFDGNDGEVATIAINVSGTLKEGDYPIILRKIEQSEVTGFHGVKNSYFKSTLTVTKSIKGDVTCDGKVDIEDVVAIIKIINGGDSTGLNIQAADYDNNSKVEKADVEKLVEDLIK